ncbi:hypothetical protein PG994_003348 [Apiospora phragmitis]|uniref:Uncharacterized protein n=1 Tax=Apiospora phragmitis TaxID=2905665 RepID=A0ABR1VXU3_9PEZI
MIPHRHRYIPPPPPPHTKFYCPSQHAFSRTPESKQHPADTKGAAASGWDSRTSRDSASLRGDAASTHSFRPRSKAGTNYFGDSLGDLGDIASGIAWDIPHLDLDVRNMRMSGVNQSGGPPSRAAPPPPLVGGSSLLSAVQSVGRDSQDDEIDQMRRRLKTKTGGDYKDLVLCRMVPQNAQDEQQTRVTHAQLEDMVGATRLEVCKDARSGAVKFWMAFLSESQYIQVKLMPSVSIDPTRTNHVIATRALAN